MEEIEKNKFKIRKDILIVKVLIIIGLILLLLIPSGFILALIFERQGLRDSALEEVSSKWGKEQNIGGPVLYVKLVKNGPLAADEDTNVKYLKILPSDISINGNILPELRYRGIYKFALYSANLNISGKFEIPDKSDLGYSNWDIVPEESFVIVGISDMIGIKDSIKLKWNSTDSEFYPGVKVNDIFSSGIWTKVVPKAGVDNLFSFNLNVRGSENIKFLPLGKETNVKIDSNWGEPSFVGAFLPVDRSIVNNKFEAKWKVLDFNRNYSQKWVDADADIGEKINQSAFGLKLLIPVDEYKETLRAVKYMIMFVGLTFIVFFFVELLNKKRIHPIQYLLVGFSLIMFYMLLLSISEHIKFNIAYLLSTITIVLLISTYSYSILKSKKMALCMAVFLSSLYSFLYVLLRNQDYSLIIGTLGLFVILSVIMYLTRNIDWYDTK